MRWNSSTAASRSVTSQPQRRSSTRRCLRAGCLALRASSAGAVVGRQTRWVAEGRDGIAAIIERGRRGELDAVVRRFVEQHLDPVASLTQLPGGIMNAAFEAVTVSRDAVVVRVAQRGAPHFEAEREVLDVLAPHGLPTPRVVALQHFGEGREMLSAIALSKLPGQPMGERERIAGHTPRQAVAELGALLARIHLVTLDQSSEKHPGWLAGRLDDLGWMKEGAGLADVDWPLVQRAVEAVRACPRPRGQRALIHNDFKAGNILVDRAGVTGILDFEFSARSDPSRDLAFWTFWHGEEAGELLRGGYEDAAAPLPDLDLRIALYRLEIAISYLEWFRRRGVWPGAAELVTRNLLRATAALS